MLKSIYLGFRKAKVQRVTVVEFGMYNRGGDGVGCLEVKVGANAAQLTNVIVADRDKMGSSAALRMLSRRAALSCNTSL